MSQSFLGEVIVSDLTTESTPLLAEGGESQSFLGEVIVSDTLTFLQFLLFLTVLSLNPF